MANILSPQELYNEYLQSDVWKLKRDAALERAEHHCQLCCSTYRLSVHHNNYERLGNERDADLVVLCGPCHDVFHAKRDTRTAKKYGGENWMNRRADREYSALPPSPAFVAPALYFTDKQKADIRLMWAANKYVSAKTLAKMYRCHRLDIMPIVADIAERQAPPKKIKQRPGKRFTPRPRWDGPVGKFEPPVTRPR